MSAGSALVVPAQRTRVSALEPAGSVRFVGRAAADPVAALAARMRHACTWAVDADEVAALLEASGINDRIAADEYGVPTVFALARRIIDHAMREAAMVLNEDPPVDGPGPIRIVADTLVRSIIYVTPLAIG